MNGKALAKKARTIGTVVLVVYAVTVATNLGEFWPFSIYPMFSQGGNNWSRSLVREFPEDETTSWEVVGLADVPGAPFSVKKMGVDPIDLANFVSKTTIWDSVRVAALRNMFFGSETPLYQIVIYRVRGELTEDHEVLVEATPYVLLSPKGDQVNPEVQQ